MNLILGGTGLVGSHLLLELLSKGEKVKALIRPTSSKNQILNTFKYHTANADELFSRIEWIEGDIMDYNSVIGALAGTKFVYHCAALVSFSPRHKELLLRNNVDGTANVVNACLKHGGIKLCFVSSIAALGHSESLEEVTEAHMWKPTIKRTVYSVSKFKSEMEVWRGIEEGLEAVIVNPSVILGPGNWKSGSSSFFPFVHKGLRYYTKGVTGFVDVRDVAKAMVQLMQSPLKNDRFILSAGNKSFKELFGLIAEALNVKPPKVEATPLLLSLASKLDGLRSALTFSERKISDDTISAATGKNFYSNKKICTALGFQFRPLQETVKDCAGMYLKHMSN
ncbi:MAG TPA: NAD-dependent epimerase/dehydratase family protein [Bacteroidales bacterium]|nr:NAD-dependent epimerase/dehydratase family protein [Bacteroidales bacterium]